MKAFKKPSLKHKSEILSHRSIKEEVCRETMATKYLNLVDKNKNLTKLMKKFITDPDNKMKSVCQSYLYHSNLAHNNFRSIQSQIGKFLFSFFENLKNYRSCSLKY